MNRKKTPRRIFSLPLLSGDRGKEVDEEIRFHVREQTEKLIEKGWTPAEAVLEAGRRFGDESSIREECRAIGKSARRRQMVSETLGSIVRDVRHSMRSYRKHLAFTGLSLSSLALGIGANIVVFTLFYTVLFEPLPYPEENRLLFVEETAPAWQIDQMGFSYPDLVDFRDQNAGFTHLAGFLFGPQTLAGQGEPERILGCQISADLLGALGVQPVIGRSFRPEEEGEGAEAVVLISAGLWERRFGGDPGVTGQTISLGGEQVRIIGVMPSFFRFPSEADFWMPFRLSRVENRGVNNIGVIGRLRPGTRIEDAEANLGRIAQEMGGLHWGRADALGAKVTPLRSWLLGDWREPVLAFYAVVSLVLLLACANVASLLMARNTTRQKEVAVRVALGAGRTRIARQLLTEGITLTLIGGALGMALGFFGRDLLIGLSPVALPPYLSFAVRPVPILIITGIIVSCGILFSLGPAIAATHTDVGDTLRSESARASSGAGRIRFRSALVALEVAMALAVLIGGGLMFKSLIRQMQVDPGFESAGVVSLQLDLPEARYREEGQVREFYRRLLADVAVIPGVNQVSITTDLPTGRISRESNVYPEGVDLGSTRAPIYPYSMVSTDFFETMGIPLLQGRDFTNADREAESSQGVIVNERFARVHWPNEDPIGQRINRGDGPPATAEGWSTVVGVVGSTFTDGYGQTIRPAVFRFLEGEPVLSVFLVAKTSVGPQSAFQQLRTAITDIDPGVPISQARTMDRALLEVNWQIRFYTWLFGIFSFIAVILASAGVYGVMSFAVSSRSKEFSLRMAVGAQPRQVTLLVLRKVATLSAVGLTLGLLGSVGGVRLLSGMLFQVSSTDLWVFFFAAGGMAAITLIAGYFPTRRILRIQPMAVLREE